MEKIGSGYLYLTGNNTYTGKTLLSSGTMYIGLHTETGSIASKNIENNGELFFVRTNEYTYAGVISGSGKLYKWGSEKLILTGTNTYQGATVVMDGTLQIGASGSIASSSEVDFDSNTAILDVSKGNQTIKGLTASSYYPNAKVELGSRTLTIDINTGMQSFYGQITGTGGITKTGAGSLILAGANSYSGKTTISAGSLLIGYNTTTGSITGPVENNSALYFNRSNDYTYVGVITGSGSVFKECAGTLTLTGNNLYTGSTWVNHGTLAIGASGTISSSSEVILYESTAKLNISAGNQTIKGLGGVSGTEVVLGTRTLTINNSSDCRFYGQITGTTGGITKTGGGSLTLAGNNTYTGKTLVSDGDLYIGNNTTTGSIAGPIENNSNLYFDRSNEYTYAGVISGSGKVYKSGSGRLILTGTNLYSGATIIDEGTLQISGSISSSSVVTLQSSTAKFDVSKGNKTIKGLDAGSSYSGAEVILGTSTLTINGGGLFYGYFSGNGGVTKTGSAYFNINNNNNTATGVFSQNSGAVSIKGNWAGDYTKASNLELSVIDNVTIGKKLSLSGGRINMNLMSPASKITVGGAVSATGTNTVVIAAVGTADSYPLITAASGLNASAFTLSGASGYELSSTATQLTLSKASTFVAVTNITGVPTAATAGTPLTLTGTVAPANATNQTIVWSVKTAGTTGATISGNTLNTTAAGTVTVTATIANGKTSTTAYTQDFPITVSAAFVAVMNITGVPTAATAGTPLTLTGTVAPADATNQTIVWSVKTAGTTGATISGSTLNTTAAGTVTVTATIANGKTSTTAYTQDFPITVSAAFVAVTNITDVPTAATAGTPLTLSGTVAPANATNQTIVWSVKTAGTTGATISGSTLNTTAAGTVTVTATIANGKTSTTAYTQDFEITVNKTTGIDDIQSNLLKTWIQDRHLHISGLTVGEMISIYNVSGNLVYQATAVSSEAVINLNAQSIYIVKQGNHTIKITYYR